MALLPNHAGPAGLQGHLQGERPVLQAPGCPGRALGRTGWQVWDLLLFPGICSWARVDRGPSAGPAVWIPPGFRLLFLHFLLQPD